MTKKKITPEVDVEVKPKAESKAKAKSKKSDGITVKVVTIRGEQYPIGTKLSAIEGLTTKDVVNMVTREAVKSI